MAYGVSMSSHTVFETPNVNYVAFVRRSFERQAFMATLGAAIESVEAGLVEISMPFRTELTQQHGFMHAGAIAAILDSACGYAALTLMPEGSAVLSVEYKINLLRPARGERFSARSRVVKPGSTLTFCEGKLIACADDEQRLVATMTATMMQVTNRPELEG